MCPFCAQHIQEVCRAMHLSQFSLGSFCGEGHTGGALRLFLVLYLGAAPGDAQGTIYGARNSKKCKQHASQLSYLLYYLFDPKIVFIKTDNSNVGEDIQRMDPLGEVKLGSYFGKVCQFLINFGMTHQLHP